MHRFAITALTALVTSAALFGCDTQNQVFNHTTQGTVPITEVVVSVDLGTVQVTSSETTQVKSAAVARWVGDKPEVEFVQEGTKLMISASCAESNEFCDISLAFDMPTDAKLTIEGSTTEVTVASLRGPATIDLNEGDISLEQISGTLDVATHKGSISATGLNAARATMLAWSGKIDAEFKAPIVNVHAETGYGDIHLKVPDMAYDVAAKTNEGNIDVDVKQASDGRRLITALATESGNISIGH